MSRTKLISAVEFTDHKIYYDAEKIEKLLIKANFSKINYGYFEFNANLWIYAYKL